MINIKENETKKIVKGKSKELLVEYKEDANTVVFAIGLKPNKNLVENQNVKLDDWGYISIDENGKII
mgnify:CR=1 FL=1